MRRKIVHYEVQYLQCGKKCDEAFHNCYKKEHHKNYLCCKELAEYLPIKDDVLFDFMSAMCLLTGMVEMPSSGGVRCGTCFVQKIDLVSNTCCPCPECKGLGNKNWGKVTLSVALHVIPDERDAVASTVRLFYDSSDSEGQEKTIYGWKSHSRDEEGDWCALVCVTHDLDLLGRLANTLNQYWRLGNSLKEKYQDSCSNLVVIVSHPHGGPKRISIGKGKIKDFAKEVRDDQDWCYYSYDATTCDGSSGAPVYILGRWNDGFGYWFGHSHNHCGVDERLLSSSTIGVDSTFGQLTKSYSSTEMDDKYTVLQTGECHLCAEIERASTNTNSGSPHVDTDNEKTANTESENPSVDADVEKTCTKAEQEILFMYADKEKTLTSSESKNLQMDTDSENTSDTQSENCSVDTNRQWECEPSYGPEVNLSQLKCQGKNSLLQKCIPKNVVGVNRTYCQVTMTTT